jgi:hypothetical protein
MHELQAMGLIGQMLSGPWMKKFYSNDSSLSYVDSIRIVMSVIGAIKDAKDGHLSFSHDFFGNPIDVSRAPDLFNDVPGEVRAMLSDMLSGILDVLDKQYAKYVNMTPQEMDELTIPTSGARLHNVDAEEVMGMFSASFSKAPNATIPYISAKIRAKKNGVMNQLVHDVPSQKEFDIAIRLANSARRRRKAELKAIIREMQKRRAAKSYEAQQKEVRKIEKVAKKLNKRSSREEVCALFNDVSEEIQDIIFSLCVGNVISQTCVHSFAEGERFEAIPWHGKFERQLVKKRVVHYEICYWDPKCSYDEHGEDYVYPLYQLVTDVVTGDLVFCDL